MFALLTFREAWGVRTGPDYLLTHGAENDECLSIKSIRAFPVLAFVLGCEGVMESEVSCDTGVYTR